MNRQKLASCVARVRPWRETVFTRLCFRLARSSTYKSIIRIIRLIIRIIRFPFFVFIDLPILNLSVCLYISIYIFFILSIYLANGSIEDSWCFFYTTIYLSIYLFISFSINLSINLIVDLSIYPSHPSFYLSKNRTSLHSWIYIYIYIYLSFIYDDIFVQICLIIYLRWEFIQENKIVS